MEKLSKAKELLEKENYTCVLVSENQVYYSFKTGIAPMMEYIAGGVDLKGYVVADKIVGKAVAMLFALAGISEVYAEVLSESALPILDKYNIKYSYKLLTDKIINRQKTDICPMEKTVQEIEDLNEAYIALKLKIESLKKNI